MSEASTTVKIVLISLFVLFTIAVGFAVYESYRSVKENAGEAENQGFAEGAEPETSPATSIE